MKIASLKRGDHVEMMNPSFSIQKAQGTVVMGKHGCLLKSRQFGILKTIDGGYYYVQPVILGKRIRAWKEECYDSELKRVAKNLDIFKPLVRPFKKK